MERRRDIERQNGVRQTDMRDVESATFFANTKGITLDSIYFSGRWVGQWVVGADG